MGALGQNQEMFSHGEVHPSTMLGLVQTLTPWKDNEQQVPFKTRCSCSICSKQGLKSHYNNELCYHKVGHWQACRSLLDSQPCCWRAHIKVGAKSVNLDVLDHLLDCLIDASSHEENHSSSNSTDSDAHMHHIENLFMHILLPQVHCSCGSGHFIPY